MYLITSCTTLMQDLTSKSRNAPIPSVDSKLERLLLRSKATTISSTLNNDNILAQSEQIRHVNDAWRDILSSLRSKSDNKDVDPKLKMRVLKIAGII